MIIPIRIKAKDHPRDAVMTGAVLGDERTGLVGTEPSQTLVLHGVRRAKY